MKVALIQTKQNELYSFHNPRELIPPKRAAVLRDEMVEQCMQMLGETIEEHCDLLVTTEAINFCGLESALHDICEPLIPLYPGGEIFGRLADMAKRAQSWLVAGVYNKRYDQEGRLNCYNSAFIYNREGHLEDIYDKIHLAGTEKDCLSSGNRVVAIETDMGKMGVAICYDMQFQDVCRGCKEAGAEFMAVPTWGWEHGYGRKRIQETGLSIAAAMAVPYWMPIEGERSPSELIDGRGKIVASAGREKAQVLIGNLSI